MKTIRIALLRKLGIPLWILLSASCLQAKPWEFFAMDNGVGRGLWSPERQAEVLEEIGFAGISYNYTNVEDLKVWLRELNRRRLKLYGLYFPVRLEGDPPLSGALPEVVALLRGSGAVLWVTVPKSANPGNHESMAIQRVRQVADLAAQADLRIVLYPHNNFYVATAEQAWALLRGVERPNVGLSINLYHELAAGHGPRLPEIIRRVAPHLEMVSINGTNHQASIQLLGEGEYDVGSVLRALAEVNYAGPVGLQGYRIPGDPRTNLATSMRAWKALLARL